MRSIIEVPLFEVSNGALADFHQESTVKRLIYCWKKSVIEIHFGVSEYELTTFLFIKILAIFHQKFQN